jgi:dynein heavy chain
MIRLGRADGGSRYYHAPDEASEAETEDDDDDDDDEPEDRSKDELNKMVLHFASDDVCLDDLRSRTSVAIHRALAGAGVAAAVYAPYLFLLQEEREAAAAAAFETGAVVRTLSAEPFPAGVAGSRAPTLLSRAISALSSATSGEASACLRRYCENAVALRTSTASSVSLGAGLLVLSCSKLSTDLARVADGLAAGVLSVVAETVNARNVSMCSRCKLLRLSLRKRPATSEELLAQEAFTRVVEFGGAEAPNSLSALRTHADETKRLMSLLFDNDDFLISEPLLQQAGHAFAWLRRVVAALSEARAALAVDRKKLEQAHESVRNAFMEELLSIEAQLNSLSARVDVRLMTEHRSSCAATRQALRAAELRAAAVNTEAERLALQCRPFTELADFGRALSLYELLWSVCCDYHQQSVRWDHGPLIELNADDVERQITFMLQATARLSTALPALPAGVADLLRRKLEEHRLHLPLLQTLCNRRLADRHWKAMSEVVGFKLEQGDAVLSLKRALDRGLSTHLAALQAISEQGSKEGSIEEALDRMVAEWRGMSYAVTEYKSTNTLILQVGLSEVLLSGC